MTELAEVLAFTPGLAAVREHLEAVIWRLFPRATPDLVDRVLAAADAYAVTLIDEQTIRHVLGTMRLAEATAEYSAFRRVTGGA